MKPPYNKRNKVIDLKKFSKRLTKWADYNSLDLITYNFISNNQNSYGVDFVIKRNNITKQYAIFIHQDNKLRRVDDNALKFNIGDLLLSKLYNKREGISIFKTYFMTK